MRSHALTAFLLMAAAAAQAQNMTCPALPAGASCDHYHYHYKVWTVSTRTYEDVQSYRNFISVEACDRAKADAAKRNQALVDFMKNEKVDGSFSANVYGDCHCDRTDEKGSPVYQDARVRTAILQRLGESEWLIRERLLSAEKSSAAEVVQSLFAAESLPDRFCYQKFPAAIPEDRGAVASATLADTKIGERSQTTEIAPSATLVDVPMPAAVPRSAASPHDTRKPPTPANRPAAPDGRPPTPRSSDGIFFDYEMARIAAILKASEAIPEPSVREAIRTVCEDHRKILQNLAAVATSAPPTSPLNAALLRISNETDRLAFVRALFGQPVVVAWAPSDARDVLAPVMKSEADDPVQALVTMETKGARSAALYTVLSSRAELSDAERPTVLRAIESLLGGQQ